MALLSDIDAKLKEAMLARDQFLTGVLRDLKSAFLYDEVAKGKREEGLSDEEMQAVIAKEVKKRDDAIEIYTNAGDKERAEKEKLEREVLVIFLPEQLTDDELIEIIKKIITDGSFTTKDMGRVIGNTKTEVGVRGDGAKIAKLTKELLQ